jgi:hypothetical protein
MSIKDKLVDPSGLEITGPDSTHKSPSEADLQPRFNSMMRYPLPPVTVSPDSLRQFYRGGILPQKRLLSPPTIGTSGGTGKTTIIGTSSNVTVPASTVLKVKQTAITTTSLGIDQIANAVVLLGKTFQLVTIASNSSARIELYGSSQIRSIDSFRAIDTPPDAGTNQGIICDLVLDTSPLIWNFQNLTGTNGDAPQTNVVYAAITNIGTGNTSIVVTLVYVSFVD